MEPSSSSQGGNEENDGVINAQQAKTFKCFLIYELSLAFAFIVLPFFLFSYLNCINLISGQAFLIILYQGSSPYVTKLKGILLFCLLCLNVIEFLLRLLTLTFIWIDYGGDILIVIGRYFIVYKAKVPLTIFGFVVAFLLICLLVVFHFLKKWESNDCNKAIDLIIGVKHVNKEFVLSLGLFFICIGASIFPTTIGFIFILIAFIHFFAVATNQQLGLFIINIISYIVLSLIPIYFLFNYLMSCEFLLQFHSHYPMTLLGLLKLYALNDDDEFYAYNTFQMLPFLFYLIGFFLIVVYRQMEATVISKRKGNFIIDFFKSTPGFSLHLCRIGIIVWVGADAKVYSLVFITWMLLSMIFYKNKLFFLLTKYILFLLLFICFATSYFGNINGIDIANSNRLLILFGIEKFNNEIEAFLHLTLKIVVTAIFGFFIHIRIRNEKSMNELTQEFEMNIVEEVMMNFKEESLIKEEEEEESIRQLEMDKQGESMYILTWTDILFKLFFWLNDWLLVIFLYLSISQSYNLLNGVVLLFLIGVIIDIKSLHKAYYIILLLLNLSFLAKYICYFFYPTEGKTLTEEILALLFYDYLYGSIYLWVAFYCLYTKYSSLKSPVYSQYHIKQLSFDVLIERRFKNFKRIKLVLHLINSFASGLYIWALFPLIVFSLLLCKNNVLFFGLLLILFWIYYKYILLLGINFKQENTLLFSSRIFIVASIVVTLLVYIWQILQADIALEAFPIFKEKETMLIMDLIGLFNLRVSKETGFFPYIFLIVIAAALHQEISSQIKGSEVDNIKNTRFYSKRLASMLYYLLHYYWILIFLVVTVFSIHWMLSASMAIELLLFSYYIMKSFRGYYQCLNQKKDKSYSKLYQYNLEKRIHYTITSENQQKYINVVWTFTFGFIIVSYISCLIFKFLNYDSPNEVDVILYVLGFFSSSYEALDFLLYSWGYFIIVALFSLRAYFLSKYFDLLNAKEMKRKKRNEERHQQQGNGSGFKEEEEKNDKEAVELGTEAIGATSTINLFRKEKENVIAQRRSSFDNGIFISNEIHLIINDFDDRVISSSSNDEDLPHHKSKYDSEPKDNRLSPNSHPHPPKPTQSKDDSYLRLTHLKKSPSIDYSFHFMSGMKKTIELVIIVLVLTSAIIKINIISFLLLFCLILIYNKGLNVSIMFNFSFIILSLFIIQYLLFVSNISNDTNPLYDTNMINYLEEVYAFPWYKQVFGRKWGIFCSCGVFSYQLNSLWLDVIILITLYFYLEFFSFSIFEEDNQFNTAVYHEQLLSLVDMKVLNTDQYHHFIKSMMMSYDIILKGDCKRQGNGLGQKAYLKNQSESKRKEVNKKRDLYKYFRHYLYLSFHYFSLILILLLSSMNKGLISLGYISFSMFYIYKSHSFILGFKWTLGRGLKYFLKPYLFLDLLLQCLFAIPLDYFKLHSDSFEDFLGFLGLQKLVNYNYKEQFLNTSGFLLVLLKVFSFFLIYIQEMIYDSNDFKEFILKYHLKYYQKGFVNGRLHSFLFNNNRIKLMKNRLEERDEINETLVKLHSRLVHWNKSIAMTFKGRSSSIFKYLHKESRRVKGREADNEATANKKLSIEAILRKQWLISIALSCNELLFSIGNRHKDNSKQIKRILRGEVSVKCDLDRAIELFGKERQPKMSYQFIMAYITKKEQSIKKDIEDVKDDADKSFKDKANDDKEDNQQEEDAIDSITDQEKYKSIIKDEFFFSSADYYDFKENLRAEFFSQYFSKGRIILFIIQSFLLSLVSKFENVCYFLMVLIHFQNGGLMSIIYPIFVFTIGIMEYPRLDKLYWKISIIYCSIVIFIKFFFQLNLLKITTFFDSFLKNDNLFNIKQCPSAKCTDFFSYVILDFLLLIALLIHQFMLVRKGLWNYNEIDYETVEEAQERIFRSNSKRQRAADRLNEQSSGNDISKLVGTVTSTGATAEKQKLRQFFNRNFPSVRNEKPGKDYYAYYTIFQMLIIIYIIFFYTKMDQDKLIDNPDSFMVKQFSGDSIICALIQLCLIVLDRFIYVKNARTLKKIAFKVYDNHTGADVTEQFNVDDYEEAKRLCDESDRYSIACFQFEGPKRALVIKFAMQIITVLAIHYFVYWFLPYQGKQNTSELINTVNSNPFILIFYIMYCFYFLFSGLQIKSGMADMRKLPTLMKGSSIVSSCIFKAYRAIPFLQELKAFIDWTFTVTALDIFKWLKFEETFALLYIAKCFQKSYFGRRVGSRVTKLMKRLIGVSSTFGLLVLLFGPLFLFSNLNPINLINQVNGAFLQATLGITENNLIKRNFTLITSRNALSIVNINQADFEYLSKEYPPELKNYQIEQIQNISMMGYSEENWNINLKALKYIQNAIKDETTEEQKLTFEIIFQYSFSSALDATQSTYNGFQTLKVNNTVLQPFFHEDIISCKNASVSQALTTFETNIRVPSQSIPKPLFKAISQEQMNIYLHCQNKLLFWTIKNSKEEDLLKFTTYTDKFSSATAGYDVLTFYITFILVAGQFLRSILLGEAERIVIIEMVDPSQLLHICQGIRISRIRKDFLKEDKLFYILIDLMRSPEILKSITKSSLNYTSTYNVVKTKEKEDKVIESFAIKKSFTSTYRKAFD